MTDQKLTLIIPAAGKSSRFQGSRPKYLRTLPNSDLMLVEAIKHLDTSNVSRIIITVVDEHIKNSKVDLKLVIARIFELKGIRPEFLILDSFTASQSETVCKTIKEKLVVGPFVVKDCDNLFDCVLPTGNCVCVYKLQSDTNAVNKAYVRLDKFGFISGIVEKTVLNDVFCCGAYSFADADSFVAAYEKIQSVRSIEVGEIYISHIIQQMILDNAKFSTLMVSDYIDLGTLEDWNNYIGLFKTLFIDIDGVLVKNGGEYFEPKWGWCEPLEENVKLINRLYSTDKVMVILTTARSKKYEQETVDDLKHAGVKYHQIVYGVLHAQRILINDFANSNPYPSAVAINIKRDMDQLSDYLKQ